jgi:hypothetical protein
MYFASVNPEAVAVFIPVVAILGGAAIAITAIMAGGKQKELAHRERMTQIEKGIHLPEPEIPKPKPVYSARRAGGLMLTGIGLALWISISFAEGARDGIWGILPLFLGLGLLIASILDKREYDREMSRHEQEVERIRNGGARQRAAGAPAPPSHTDPSGYDNE